MTDRQARLSTEATAGRNKPAETPSFGVLTRAQIEALLARNNVGRIAYAFHNRVDIEPIHYVSDGEALCLRTTSGSKLTAVSHSPWVAFEVDEVRGIFEWQSVVLHGTLYVVEQSADPGSNAVYERTLARIRTLIPEALAEGDPTPFRSIVYRLHIDEAEGRSATPARRGHGT